MNSPLKIKALSTSNGCVLDICKMIKKEETKYIT